MLRFTGSVICTALLSAVITWWLPWWTLGIVCFITAPAFHLRPAAGFLSGFLAIAILWTVWGWFLSAANNYLLLDKMAHVFQLSRGWMYLAFSALTGGLAGGLCSWSGTLLIRRRMPVTG